MVRVKLYIKGIIIVFFVVFYNNNGISQIVKKDTCCYSLQDTLIIIGEYCGNKLSIDRKYLFKQDKIKLNQVDLKIISFSYGYSGNHTIFKNLTDSIPAIIKRIDKNLTLFFVKDIEVKTFNDSTFIISKEFIVHIKNKSNNRNNLKLKFKK